MLVQPIEEAAANELLRFVAEVVIDADAAVAGDFRAARANAEQRTGLGASLGASGARAQRLGAAALAS